LITKRTMDASSSFVILLRGDWNKRMVRLPGDNTARPFIEVLVESVMKFTKNGLWTLFLPVVPSVEMEVVELSNYNKNEWDVEIIFNKKLKE